MSDIPEPHKKRFGFFDAAKPLIVEAVTVEAAGGVVEFAEEEIVTGGPGWREQIQNPAMLDFLSQRSPSQLASVCTGALILAASGRLAGKSATTRRNAVGSEKDAPIDLLGKSGHLLATPIASIVDDVGTVSSGGVSLAIDGMLYILGRLYGDETRDEIASIIEYDRAYAANREGLGHVLVS